MNKFYSYREEVDPNFEHVSKKYKCDIFGVTVQMGRAWFLASDENILIPSQDIERAVFFDKPELAIEWERFVERDYYFRIYRKFRASQMDRKIRQLHATGSDKDDSENSLEYKEVPVRDQNLSERLQEVFDSKNENYDPKKHPAVVAGHAHIDEYEDENSPPNHLLFALTERAVTTCTDEEKAFVLKLKRLCASAPKADWSIYDDASVDAWSNLEIELSESHPVMHQVTNFLIDELLLSSRQIKPSPRPILMVGPPGVGKTYFANDLASRLKVPFVSMSLATADTPWPLTGNNSSWSKAKPSNVIFEIAKSNCRSGLIFIDEIGAAAEDHSRNYPILPTLLELLDLEQSARFRDHFFGFDMDLSGWIKILSCNSVSGIDKAILDRCQVIEIKRPSSEQQLRIIELMVGKLPVDFSMDALVEINRSSRSLRQVQADLRKLAARALRNGFDKVQLIDAKRLQIPAEFRV
ncbi:MAG TPA: AAA family ATPase [Limnobacter sp.]|uniref:AAA family ATPase n=1 Tax=Limnobacter sp. TaxID=2003368 RepID=UPI002EDB45AC